MVVPTTLTASGLHGTSQSNNVSFGKYTIKDVLRVSL
jgi:hypothetical protein